MLFHKSFDNVYLVSIWALHRKPLCKGQDCHVQILSAFHGFRYFDLDKGDTNRTNSDVPGQTAAAFPLHLSWSESVKQSQNMLWKGQNCTSWHPKHHGLRFTLHARMSHDKIDFESWELQTKDDSKKLRCASLRLPTVSSCQHYAKLTGADHLNHKNH